MSILDAAPGSPVDDLRADYEERQRVAEPKYVDVWEGGKLVALVGMGDLAAARGALRTMATLTADEATVTITLDDLADVIAACTVSLHKRQPDGTLIPKVDTAGLPLRFGAEFAARLGYPEVTQPRDAVLIAFTEGEPPDVHPARLMLCATAVAGVLMADREDAADRAEVAVGEVDAPNT